MARFKVSDCTSRRAPGRVLRRIDKLMQGLVGEGLAVLGIGYPAWATLKLVREGVVGTASELARELGYTSGAVTRLIDGLEQKGLIARDRDEADRRVVRLRVTAAGDDVVDRGKPIAIDLWNGMLADLDQAEADQFVDTLCKLLDAIETKIAERDVPVARAAE